MCGVCGVFVRECVCVYGCMCEVSVVWWCVVVWCVCVCVCESVCVCVCV